MRVVLRLDNSIPHYFVLLKVLISRNCTDVSDPKSIVGREDKRRIFWPAALDLVTVAYHKVLSYSVNLLVGCEIRTYVQISFWK